MASDFTRVRFLLDEHYPGWLAEDLTADGYDTAALTSHRPELRGADDGRVLAAAVAEERVVVTEDVSTFSSAVALVPDHLGVVYCHHSRYPRTRPGLERLRKALGALAAEAPGGGNWGDDLDNDLRGRERRGACRPRVQRSALPGLAHDHRLRTCSSFHESFHGD